MQDMVRPTGPRLMRIAAALSLALAVVVVGCTETRVVRREGFANWGQFGTDPTGVRDDDDHDAPTVTGGGTTNLAPDAAWAIELVTFEHPGHEAAAADTARQYEQQTGEADFWVRSHPTRSTVYFGKYRSRNAHQAQRDLAKLRGMRGRRGFAPTTTALTAVMLNRPTEHAAFDLRHVPESPDAVYTLQIAMYDELAGEDFRKQAERQAARLRERDEEAYFYHGPRHSLVTVGVFPHDAITVIQSGPRRGLAEYHPQITEHYQQRHPHLQVNGQPQPMDESGQRLAPTVLVRIPQSG